MTDPTPTDDPRKWLEQHAEPALKRTPNVRYWAFDHDAKTATGALACTWYKARVRKDPTTSPFHTGDLSAFYGEVAPHVPGMLQEKPDKELPPISAWVDPVSQQQARNPFAEPQDIASQVIVTKTNPRLAEHLRRIAKDNGVSYAYLHEIRAAEEARKRRRAIQYGAAEHTVENNPFLDPQAITKQSALMTADPELALFYKREAEASPIRLPWSPVGKKT